MTLQGTNSYLLQPPSNPLAPIILIDTSSPHTAQQYVDLLVTHLHHLGLESGVREVHFESTYAASSLKLLPEDQVEGAKAQIVGERVEEPRTQEIELVEYGPHAKWTENEGKTRRLPSIEHIILTHRHLDHVGALPVLLKTLKSLGLPPPKIWKLPSPDEVELANSDRDRPTTDAALLSSLPNGAYTSFSPFQPFHPVLPGLMISIIDPTYRRLLKHDAQGKPKWNEVPELARVSVRCLKTPGHTQDSISLVLVEGEKGVFTGDTVLGQGTTVFTDLATCEWHNQISVDQSSNIKSFASLLCVVLGVELVSPG
jgi:glyoxylase-like metal-dependent hydrolase (beta-lactamase superfamily II)